MSALLFNPKLRFDFDKKPNKPKLSKQITSIVLLVGLFIFSLTGLVRSHIHYQIGYHHRPLISHYTIPGEILESKELVAKSKIAPSQEILPVNPISDFSVDVPILMYHYTPLNFEEQLEHLHLHGYQTITMYELGRHLFVGTPLPTKPVVITFDDGFADQQKALDLLKKYNMKATFYFILGGEESNHCIGIARTNLNCGDDYFNEQQIWSLLDSGLIEIGAHTLNHPNLVSLPQEKQQIEILESKKQLESKYNISVTSLAYPYGIYNQQVIDLAKSIGYLTAVTTEAGSLQSSENRLKMPRIRSALLLP